MKKLLLIFFISLFFFFYLLVYAQGSNWVTVSESVHDVSFSMPTEPLVFDTMRVKMYSCNVDSILGLQVHFFDSAYFNSESTIFNEALTINDNDTLRAIAQLSLLITGSELTGIEDINLSNGLKGIEFSFRYPYPTIIIDTTSSDTTLTYFHSSIRYFLIQHKFIAFSITGIESDLTRMVLFKNEFFDSIAFQ